MKKILLIEDHDELRENVAEILELSNYQVLKAKNGKMGVETALKERPDLIICDVIMPGLDGYGVLYSLQQHPATSGIPFIFLSAKMDKTDIRRGMMAGADDYLIKPFDGIELLKAIETSLKKHEHRLREIPRQPEKGEVRLIDLADREIALYGKKQMIYTEGQRPAHLHYIVSGKVKAYKAHLDGKEFITGIFGPGDFIGYMALLEDTNYQDSAQVLEDAEIISVPRQEFLQMISSNAAVARQFIRLMARNAVTKEEDLLNLAYNSLRKRVANGLLQLADKFRDEQGAAAAIGISRENLAHIIGSATESLTRTLGEFRQEKLIDIRDGKLYLLNEKKLRNLAN
ncbi:MAG: response regulator [Puia sp.]|nr:response regulator [Puia sp.]